MTDFKQLVQESKQQQHHHHHRKQTNKNNNKEKNKTSRNNKPWGEGENLISRIGTVYYFKCQFINRKIMRNRNRNRKVWLIHRERKRSTETVSKEARLYLADRGFKSAISNRLKY